MPNHQVYVVARSWNALTIAVLMAAGLSLPSPAAAAANPHASIVSAAAKTLAKYLAVMMDLPKPANMIFTYAEMRSGPQRIVSGVYRVYRDSAGNQRNDTIELNGSPVRPPRTRTFQRSTWPYYADQFAVTPANYRVSFIGAATVGGRRAYVFDAKRNDNATFAITQITLDASSGLPLRERFASASDNCDGRGTIEFAASGAFWLPSRVDVGCTMTSSGDQYRDTIDFSDFSFPEAIPADVLHPAGASAQ